ncbi:MAG: molybdenum cofactor synthesis domain-containing protein [Gammaproteobacteria bacterium]|nr:molybdenum cofactor synthesis domain-containing protein [Gammaproteobacteria bacterium]
MAAPDPKPPIDFCYEGDPDLLPVAEAQRRIAEHVPIIGETESVALRDALGRILSEDAVSPIDVPGHTNAAMDGYAVRGVDLPHSGTHSFRVVGRALAGAPHRGRLGEDETVRIMTGAVMPDGADAVVMLEQVEESGDTVIIGAGQRAGQNVRLAGEDLKRGDVAVKRGTRLMPAELGLLASLGKPEVQVFRRPRVACFSTGDEVLEPGDQGATGMVYDSNRYTLRGMLGRLGAEFVDLGIVPDNRDALREAFSGAQGTDAIITSGGVSAGDADYVKQTLDELGRVGFWKIAIRPGRPLAFGLIGGAAFFALPGNPVAVMVTFYQFVQPALRQLMGERAPRAEPLLSATCESRLRKKKGRVEYYRAVLGRNADGALVVRSTGKTGSGLLHTMSDANCFIILDDDDESVEPGALVDVQPFFGLV